MDAILFLTIAGSGAGVVGLVYMFLRNLKTDLNERFNKIEHIIEKLDEKVTDIDRRLCRLEGAFSSKDCCMIKEDKQSKKAE